MNNREYLNGLSDEELIKWKYTACNELLDCIEEPCSNNLTRCYKCGYMKDWLQADHETSADEDFADIGFDKEKETETGIDYSDAFGRRFSIWRNDLRFKTCSEPIKIWNDRNIDQIRTIADKKRREMGWDK